MNLSDAIINPWTVNIFCDASTTTHKRNIIDACYGALAYSMNHKILEWYRVLHDTTSNHAELRAINLAVRLALYIRSNHPEYKNFNIFSDSMISVFGMRDNCKRWKVLDNGLYSASEQHQLISHQEVYLETLALIVENDLNISIWHQKGHVTLSNMMSLEYAAEVFARNNFKRAKIDLNFIKYISIYNNEVDNASRRILQNTKVYEKNYSEPIYFIPYNYNWLIKEYEKIQQRGENLC